MPQKNKFAFVFPGQGSQSVGMLSPLAEDYPLIIETFSEASNALGFDLWELVKNGPESELNKTEITQPALLTAGVAMWRLWEDAGGGRPEVMAGHSLGEYTALVCSEVITFADTVALVAERGRLMQEAVPAGTGAMTAILGLDDDVVEDCCNKAREGQIVSIANFNSPGQIVIAGHAEAVERASALAKAAGAKRVVPLPVSVPSHCQLMKAAADKFAERLDSVSFSDGKVPVIQNVDTELRINAAEIKTVLIKQLHQPVKWVETILKIKSMHIAGIIESGPGKVLTGLIKRIDRELNTVSLTDKQTLETALATY